MEMQKIEDEQNDKETIRNYKNSTINVCVSVYCSAFDFPDATLVTGPVHIPQLII